MCRAFPSRHAFTLIELLVVISIIALLIAMLLPMLKAARESARNMQCLSNQRQVSIAMSSYQGDNQGDFPLYSYPGQVPSKPFHGSKYANQNWPVAMYMMQYLREAAQVLSCPSFIEGKQLTNDPAILGQDPHYGYNYQHIGSSRWVAGMLNVPSSDWGTTILGDVTPAKIEFLKKPSETYLLMDVVRDLDVPTDPRARQGTWAVDHARASQFHPASRHGPGRKILNIAYCDGRAATLEIKDPFNPYTELGTYPTADRPYRTPPSRENKWDRD